MSTDTKVDMDKIREKIRLLLNVTTGRGCTESEAATAISQAIRLLEKYNLAMSDIGTESPEAKMDNEHMNGIHYKWERVLANSIARHNMCDFVNYDGKCIIIGRAINIEVAREMFSWIATQMTNMIYDYIGERPPNISTVQWRNNFLWGATMRISTRISKLQAERHEKDAECKALVLDRRAEAIGYRNIVVFPGTKWREGKKKHTVGEGYKQGGEAGNKVRLTPEKAIATCNGLIE